MGTDRVILNTETGEIECEITEGDRIIKSNITPCCGSAGYIENFNAGKRFVKIYDEIIPLLRKELTPQELILTISLIPYACYNDCIIRKSPDNRGKILNLKELAECMEYDYIVLRRLMAAIKQKGVVAKVEVSSILKDGKYAVKDIWVINPHIFFRGDRINETVMSIFEDTKWRSYIQEQEETNR